MASILDGLTRELSGDAMRQIGNLLGADEKTAGNATGAALSVLVGALSRNASQPGGAQSLTRALSEDHDGSVLNEIGRLLQDPGSGPGDGILRHVLGGRRGQVENALGRTTGLDADSVGRLLAALAPIVMGALAQQQRSGGLDANGVADLLGRERAALEQRQPQAMGLLGQLLDTDGDGDVDLSDLAKHGTGLLGKLFRK